MTDWTEFLEQALEQFQRTTTYSVFAIVDDMIMPITIWCGDDDNG